MNTTENNQASQPSQPVQSGTPGGMNFPVKASLMIIFVGIVGFTSAYLLTATISKMRKQGASPFSILTALADTVSDAFTTTTKISAQSGVVISGGKVTLQRQF